MTVLVYACKNHHDQEASWGGKGLFNLNFQIVVHHQRRSGLELKKMRIKELIRSLLGIFLLRVEEFELILYPATLLKLFIRFRSSLVEFLGSLKYTIISSANRDILNPSFLICIPLTSFCYLGSDDFLDSSVSVVISSFSFLILLIRILSLCPLVTLARVLSILFTFSRISSWLS